MSKELFYLPDATEMLLAAIAALQHHVEFKLRDKDCTLEIDLVNTHPENEWLLRAITSRGMDRVKYRITDKDGTFLRGEYDAVRDMRNIDQMYEYAQPARKHLATVYGILVGADPEQCPDLSGYEEIKPRVDVIVLTGLETTPPDLVEWVYEIVKKRSVATYNLDSKQVTETQFRTILLGKMIVGRRSAMTYLAASVGRAVVELYPKYYHKEFLSKFSRERYSMIYGQENFKKVHVQRAMEMIWAGFPVTDTAVSGEEIQTERTTSIAGAVDESFPEGLILR